MTDREEESDQLPEEGPESTSPEDTTSGGGERPEARDNEGPKDDAEDEASQATGNPDAAGG